MKKQPKQTRFYLTDELKETYLTYREAECLARIMEGDTLKDAAKILGISANTVRYHLASVKLKMRCKRRSELIKTAKKCGFVFD